MLEEDSFHFLTWRIPSAVRNKFRASKYILLAVMINKPKGK